MMGQRKMQNLSHDWPIVEPMLWAKDGPMSKRYVGPFKIYNHGPIVRRPMGQWRANVYVLSGKSKIINIKEEEEKIQKNIKKKKNKKAIY